MKKDREIITSHQSDLLTQDLVLSGVYKYCKFTNYGLSFDFPLIRYEHNTGDISYPVWQIEELKKLELSKQTLAKLINFLENELDEYKKFLKGFEEQIKTSEDGLEKIKGYFEKSKKSASTVPYFYFELSLYKQLDEEGVLPKDIPSSLTDTSLASLSLDEMYIKHQDELKEPLSEVLKSDLESFCDRFGYLGMIYFKGKPWTVSEAYEMLLASTPKDKKENLDEELSETVKVASDLLRLRTQKYELMCYGASLFRKFIKQFFSDIIDYNDLLDLRIDEAINIVDGKKSLDDIGKERKSFSLEINSTGVIFSTEGDNLIKETKSIDAKEIKGIVARPGKARGLVKIVLTSKDGNKVNKGDILVTKMSTPDFLPVMKKVSAIITDIGGITSHAAIVSRELGVPCIIGTKIATQVLKDGDTVEVDADKGVVKILKRAL